MRVRTRRRRQRGFAIPLELSGRLPGNCYGCEETRWAGEQEIPGGEGAEEQQSIASRKGLTPHKNPHGLERGLMEFFSWRRRVHESHGSGRGRDRTRIGLRMGSPLSWRPRGPWSSCRANADVCREECTSSPVRGLRPMPVLRGLTLKTQRRSRCAGCGRVLL